VSRRESLSRQAASVRIEEVEKKRKHLRKIYEEKNPRGPAFNLVIDNSTFDIEQISDQIIFAMEQKNLLKASR
jgi:cytidylate kinase